MKKPVIGITGNEKTHPDDELMMSYAAKGFIEGVKEACELMGLVLLDHLIVSHSDYFSYREKTDMI